MKKFILPLVLLVSTLHLKSQKGDLTFNLYTGISLYNNSLVMYDNIEGTNSFEGSLMGGLYFLLAGPASSAEYRTGSIPPIGFRFGYFASDKVELALDLAYSSVTLSDRYGENYREFKSSRFTSTAMLMIHPFKNWRDKGFDFYTCFGLGYRHNTKVYREQYVDYYGDIHNDEVHSRGFPFTARFGAGLTYYPIKPFGIQMQVGTGITNLQFGLVYRIEAKDIQEKP